MLCFTLTTLELKPASEVTLDKNIKDRIQITLDEYNETTGNLPSKIGDIWSNIQNAGSKLNQHSHPTSEVSGALYINVAEDDKLYF